MRVWWISVPIPHGVTGKSVPLLVLQALGYVMYQHSKEMVASDLLTCSYLCGCEA